VLGLVHASTLTTKLYPNLPTWIILLQPFNPDTLPTILAVLWAWRMLSHTTA
jgi:hypothetical protein